MPAAITPKAIHSPAMSLRCQGLIGDLSLSMSFICRCQVVSEVYGSVFHCLCETDLALLPQNYEFFLFYINHPCKMPAEKN